jgi:hypothetical protein
MLSLLVWPKVITLSGFHIITKKTFVILGVIQIIRDIRRGGGAKQSVTPTYLTLFLMLLEWKEKFLTQSKIRLL